MNQWLMIIEVCSICLICQNLELLLYKIRH